MLPIGSMLQHVFLSFRFGVYIPKFLREITQDSAGIYLSINDEKILWNSKDTVVIYILYILVVVVVVVVVLYIYYIL